MSGGASPRSSSPGAPTTARAPSPLPFQPGTSAGDYQLTPPAFAPPVFTQWPQVKPFVIRRANQFRPPPPPALTSPKYAAAINEVKALGAAQGSTRTPDQTQIGQFWNPPIWAAWNQIAQTAALAHHGTLSQNAGTFAALDLTLADSVIAFYDAKYAYDVWRPVTAIRNADADGNPDTAADPGLDAALGHRARPLLPRRPRHHQRRRRGRPLVDLRQRLRLHRHLAGASRRRALLRELLRGAHEATVSRIYNGNHTRLDQVAGENLGHDVAGFVLGRNSPRAPPRTDRSKGPDGGRRPRRPPPAGPHGTRTVVHRRKRRHTAP